MPERPAPRPVFQPRFTVSLLYTVAFFFLFALVLALPELLAADPMRAGETDAEARARGEAVVREALSAAELLLALGAALAATILGARSGRLPGLPPAEGAGGGRAEGGRR